MRKLAPARVSYRDDFLISYRVYSGGGGGGGKGGHNLPPPVRFCPFVSRLPLFIVFLLLSCKPRCLTPYSDSNRECFGLVQNKKW